MITELQLIRSVHSCLFLLAYQQSNLPVTPTGCTVNYTTDPGDAFSYPETGGRSFPQCKNTNKRSAFKPLLTQKYQSIKILKVQKVKAEWPISE